jgi:uncharacterized iron-regulated membrane protein
MSSGLWDRWFRQPQSVRFRRVLFHIHVWTGITVGLYILLICVSGSVLVYRNELYRTFSPAPIVVTGSGRSMPIEDVTAAARGAFPGWDVTDVQYGETDRHAVLITLARGDDSKRRLLHPFTGDDLGDPTPAGFRFTTWLMDLHANLLYGDVGRRVNGVGALFVLAMCLTGGILWWPGVKNCRASLTVDLRAQWRRITWSLHSALGFWFFAFIVMWGISGAYLSFQQAFGAMFDYLEPFDEANPAERVVDTIQYWLAYLHFGRVNGIGIPCRGLGLCDSASKLTWAVVGLVPPLLFLTGAVMWWNRVLCRRIGAGRRSG